jgi:hypothetical protein
MNTTMINQTTNQELLDALAIQTLLVNAELLDYAKDFYREKLTEQKIKEIISMDLYDKIWLVKQYREELNSDKPDLDSIY